MIYDPWDVNMALREDLTLLYRHASDHQGEKIEWVPLHELRKASNHPDDFTRPSW